MPQKRPQGTLLIGTSGWAYPGWVDLFYPQDLRSTAYLPYYARHFRTVEVNNSFYRLPLGTTFEKWSLETPREFVFTVKLSRYITHIQRLSGVKQATRNFLRNAQGLGMKLGPILAQLPPSLKADPKRLAVFLQGARSVAEELGIVVPLRIAFEFRHPSWYGHAEVERVLRDEGAVTVFAHSTRYPYPYDEPRTAPWVYLRFHGPRELFGSEYGAAGLKPWAAKTRGWLEEGSDVYAYFNNDAHGYAVKDAQALDALGTGNG